MNSPYHTIIYIVSLYLGQMLKSKDNDLVAIYVTIM